LSIKQRSIKMNTEIKPFRSQNKQSPRKNMCTSRHHGIHQGNQI
jgi:hypothetical protein